MKSSSLKPEIGIKLGAEAFQAQGDQAEDVFGIAAGGRKSKFDFGDLPIHAKQQESKCPHAGILGRKQLGNLYKQPL